MKKILLFAPILFILVSCGPSQKEKEEIATVTCNIMGESRIMDASIRIKEINAARDQIGEAKYLSTDKEIKEALKYGLCEELVLNDREYENKLNELKRTEKEEKEEKERKEKEEIEKKVKEEEQRKILQQQKERERAPKISIIGGEELGRSGMPILINDRVILLDLTIGDYPLFSYFMPNLRVKYECDNVQGSSCKLYTTKYGVSVSLENRGSIKLKVDWIEPGLDANQFPQASLKINKESGSKLYRLTSREVGNRIAIIYEKPGHENFAGFPSEEIVISLSTLRAPLRNEFRITGGSMEEVKELADTIQIWGKSIIIETGPKASNRQVNKVLDWVRKEFDTVIRLELTEGEATKKRDFILDVINTADIDPSIILDRGSNLDKQ